MTAPAFQSNSFFNPAFQVAEHSAVAFQQCAFSHTGFQTDPCEDKGGRSGYWRLFFMQMQEEALREGKKVPGGVPTFAGEVKAPEVEKESVKKKPRLSTAIPAQEQHIEPLPKFRRKPVYDPPNTYDALANLSHLTLAVDLRELQTTVYQFERHRVAKQKRQQTRRRAAAFLLLAA